MTGEVVTALDIGGTHVSAARVELASAAVDPEARCRLPLAADGSRAELLGCIVRAAASVAAAGSKRVGVAAPGPFDYERGVSLLRHKLEPLHGVDLRRELAGALALGDGSSVRFVNDADAFLLGEWWAGAARGYARAVGITLGSGLGSAFLADGRIVDTGPDVPPEGALHLVPFRGAPVEDVISRRGLLARYGAGAGVDVEQVAERARGGEQLAGDAFADVGRALAEFLLPWLRAFAPACLVVGGSIARAWDLMRPAAEPVLARAPSLELVSVAANIDDAPLLGAARYAGSGLPAGAGREGARES